MSTEPYALLQAYKRKNVIFHCTPGAGLKNDNFGRLENMAKWLQMWDNEKFELLEMLNERDDSGPKTGDRKDDNIR